MFEFVQRVDVQLDNNRARGVATFPSNHPLLKDHFPGAQIVPGSLLLETCAQVGGMLAEEIGARKHGTARLAILAMIRNATFRSVAEIPAKVTILVDAVEGLSDDVRCEAKVYRGPTLLARAEFLMKLAEPSMEHFPAIESRNERLRRWRTVP